jgi:transcription termination factor NusB
MAVAFRDLARSGFRPTGDLIFFGVADEEAGSAYGARWMADNHPDAIRADYVLTENGGLHQGAEDAPSIGINVAEKGVAWRRLRVDGVDTGFFRELVNGVVSGEEELSERLTVCVDRPMAQCDVMERVIILLGAWQLLNDPALPAPILIEESVDLAVRFGSDQSPGFVNGVLDRAAREWRGADAGH